MTILTASFAFTQRLAVSLRITSNSSSATSFAPSSRFFASAALPFLAKVAAPQERGLSSVQ